MLTQLSVVKGEIEPFPAIHIAGANTVDAADFL